MGVIDPFDRIILVIVFCLRRCQPAGLQIVHIGAPIEKGLIDQRAVPHGMQVLPFVVQQARPVVADFAAEQDVDRYEVSALRISPVCNG
jgi:hypothetical protein